MNNVKRALARLAGEETRHYVLLAETTRGTLMMWRATFQETDLLYARFATPDDEINAESVEERTLDMDVVHAIETCALTKRKVKEEHFQAVQSLLKAA